MRALYYPSATPAESFVQNAAFYFDELYIIHPGRDLSHGFSDGRDLSPDLATSQRRFKQRLDDFDARVVALKQEGILQTLPPLMQDHPDFIQLLISDLGDNEFETLVRASEPEKMFIAGIKMHKVVDLVGARQDVNSIRHELEERMPYWDEFGETLFNGHYGVNEVDPVVGSSILLNHAFLLGEELKFFPVTDSPLFNRLMQRKLERVAKQKGFEDFKRELDIKANTLAMRVLQEYLPTFGFRSYQHLVEARHRFRGPLTEFRQSMAAFAGEIDESPYSPLLPKKLEGVIASKVRPAVKSLKLEIERSRDAFVTKLIDNVGKGTVPMVGLLFAGLPASTIIAISAGLMTFEAAFQTYREVKRSKRNGLSLLLG